MTEALARRRGTNRSYPFNVDRLGNLYVVVNALPLPAGAATSINQVVMIAALQSIDNLTNALVSVGLDGLLVQQLVHDLLNCNANLQVGDVDVGPVNPVPIDVVNHVETTFDHGSNSAIGVVATRLIVASRPAVLGVQVKAANANTANVYVGNIDVTAATVDATDGFELGPGESILMRVDDVNRLYGISTVAPQRVFWVNV